MGFLIQSLHLKKHEEFTKKDSKDVSKKWPGVITIESLTLQNIRERTYGAALFFKTDFSTHVQEFFFHSNEQIMTNIDKRLF